MNDKKLFEFYNHIINLISTRFTIIDTIHYYYCLLLYIVEVAMLGIGSQEHAKFASSCTHKFYHYTHLKAVVSYTTLHPQHPKVRYEQQQQKPHPYLQSLLEIKNIHDLFF